ncbi:hypothetical protein QE152_g25216 [Popillia japonica]|uniref:Uncharacterized protein n=1 Tax=Popillia japonica TaxID=7064 RepID=A0AAW1K1F0_POPJA
MQTGNNEWTKERIVDKIDKPRSYIAKKHTKAEIHRRCEVIPIANKDGPTTILAPGIQEAPVANVPIVTRSGRIFNSNCCCEAEFIKKGRFQQQKSTHPHI